MQENNAISYILNIRNIAILIFIILVFISIRVKRILNCLRQIAKNQEEILNIKNFYHEKQEE